MNASNFNFNSGEKLVIKLNTEEIIEGEYISGAKDRIDLINLSRYETGEKLESSLFSFYRCEISSIHPINNQQKQLDTTSNVKSNTILILQDEYERLKTMGLSYIYMATVDKRYYDAMQHLNTCENIGVVALGRNTRLSSSHLLLLSSWDQIYIFDLLLFNQKTLPPEIIDILQSKDIRKIIHDSRQLTDSLYYSHKIKLNNVFDTQIADARVYKNLNGTYPDEIKNIGQCLNHYFNFPTNLLDKAMNVKVDKWSERPISSGTRNLAAQLSTYLFILKNHLEKLLLQEFYEDVEIYSKSTINFSPCEADMQLNSSLFSMSLTDSSNQATDSSKTNSSKDSSKKEEF